MACHFSISQKKKKFFRRWKVITAYPPLFVKKSTVEAKNWICLANGDNAVSARTCRRWYERFKSDNFELEDESRSGRPQEIDNEILEALLDEDMAQSSCKLAKQVNTSHKTVLTHLRETEKVKKYGKRVSHVLNE